MPPTKQGEWRCFLRKRMQDGRTIRRKGKEERRKEGGLLASVFVPPLKFKRWVNILGSLDELLEEGYR